MRNNFRRLALLALVLVALPAQSQPVHFRFEGPGVGYNAFGVYIGTYSGTQDYGSVTSFAVGLNCVDYFHEVFDGQQWDANITNLESSDFASTRHPASKVLYQQAAYLIANYTPSNVQATQSTVWNLFSTPGANWPSDPTLLADAQAHYDDFDYRNFYLVTDVRANGVNDDISVQEFLVEGSPQFRLQYESEGHTVTPEPSTIVLMGSGLLGIAAFRKRRQKQTL